MFLVKSLLRLRSCMTSLTSLSPGLPWTHPAHPALTGWRGRPPRGEDSEGQKSSFWAQDSWGVLDEGIRACLNLVPDLPPSHIYMANATHYGTIKAGKSRNKKKLPWVIFIHSLGGQLQAIILTIVHAHAQMCKTIVLILRAQEKQSRKNMPEHLPNQTMSSICRQKSMDMDALWAIIYQAYLMPWQQKKRCVWKRCWLWMGNN